MNKLFLSFCFISISVLSIGQSSEESKKFYQKAISEINPKHVKWIKTKAADLDISTQGISDLQKSAWDHLLASHGGAVDPNVLVQFVLRESYLQTTEDLRFYAEKVKYFNATKKLLREYVQKLRDHNTSTRESLSRSQYDSIKNFSFSIQSDMTPPSNPNINRMIKKDSLRIHAVNKPVNQTMVARQVSADEVRLLISELEQKESSLDQNSQQASIRMQALMERAQKADSMASNLYKKFAEVGHTIIANLK